MNNLGTIALLVGAGLLVWFLFFREKQQPAAEAKQKPSPPNSDKPINVGVLWQPGASVSERLSKTTNQLGLALETYCKTNPGVGICPTV